MDENGGGGGSADFTHFSGSIPFTSLLLLLLVDAGRVYMHVCAVAPG